jgi:hypothetical protein
MISRGLSMLVFPTGMLTLRVTTYLVQGYSKHGLPILYGNTLKEMAISAKNIFTILKENNSVVYL